MALPKLSAKIGIGAKLDPSVRAAFGGIDKHIKGVSESVRSLSTAQGKVSSFKRLTADVDALRPKLVAARAALAKSQAANRAGELNTSKLRKEYERQQKIVERLEHSFINKRKALATVNRELKVAGVNVKNLTSEEARLAKESEAAASKLKQFGAVRGRIRSVKSAMGELRASATRAAVAVAAVGLTVKKTVFDAAAFGDEASKTAAALQTTTRELLGLRYAGEQMGITSGTMDGALTSLTSKLQAARDGSAEARSAFAELNLDPEVLSMMSMEERLKTIGKAFQNYSGRIDKPVLVTKIFGSSAIRMSKALNASTEDWAKWSKAAQESGYVMSEANAQMSEEFQDSLGALRASITGVRNALAAKLFPVFTRVMSFFSKHTWAIKAAFAAVAVVISVSAVTAVASLGLKAVSTAKEVRGLLVAMNLLGASSKSGGIASLFSGVVGKGGIAAGVKGLIPWISKLSTVFLPGLLAAFKFVATGITTTFFNIPVFGWIAAAIAGIAFVVYKYWKPIKSFFLGFFSGIKEGVSEALGSVGLSFSDIADKVKYLKYAFFPLYVVIKGLKDAFSALIKPFNATNSQLAKSNSLGKSFGKMVVKYMLNPLSLVIDAVKKVRGAFEYFGIGGSKKKGVESEPKKKGLSKEDEYTKSVVQGRIRRAKERHALAVARYKELNGGKLDGTVVRQNAIERAGEISPVTGAVRSVPQTQRQGGNTPVVQQSNNTNTINVHPSQGMDEKALAKETIAQLKRSEAESNRVSLFDSPVLPAY